MNNQFGNKIFSLLLGSALICSCSNDDLLNNEVSHQDSVKDAYLSLSIGLPSALKSRAAVGTTPTPGESGDGHEIGEEPENKVNSLLVFGFAQNGLGTSFKKELNLSELTKLDEVFNDVQSYRTTNPFPVTSGKYHLYVMVNPSSKMKEFDPATSDENTFKDSKISYSSQEVGGVEETFQGFPMSSANEIVETEITSANTKSNPAFFSTAVQRMFAKVCFKAKSTDDLSGTTAKFAKSFKFTKYGIVNQRKEAFWFRRVGTEANNAIIGNKEDKNNYVIDPAFTEKGQNYSEEIAKKHYWNREEMSSLASYWKSVSTTDGNNIQYCFENTMKKEAQLQGYTTGLVLEASFTPKSNETEGNQEITEGQTFFKYDNKYYATKEALQKILPAIKELPSFDQNFTLDANGETQKQALIKKYGDYGVKVYYKGLCYYHYWIRHANNGDPNSMGIMEFATVRNNVYKMTVNSIKQPGEPIPPVTPDRPDEDTEVYLDVKIDVLPWVVRENSMDL